MEDTIIRSIVSDVYDLIVEKSKHFAVKFERDPPILSLRVGNAVIHYLFDLKDSEMVVYPSIDRRVGLEEWKAHRLGEVLHLRQDISNPNCVAKIYSAIIEDFKVTIDDLSSKIALASDHLGWMAERYEHKARTVKTPL